MADVDKDKVAASQLADEQWRSYVRARDNGHVQYVKMSEQCNAYYIGDQWDADVIAKLDLEKRPHQTVNTILPTVNVVLGEHSRTRADAQFKPRGGQGDNEIAQALNKVYLQIAENNNLEWLERQVFSDGVIGGRGYYDVRIDSDDSMQGEVRITTLDPHDVVLDPDAKEYDPGTWAEVFVTRWMTTEDVELMYGKEKAESVRHSDSDHDWYGHDSVVRERSFGAMHDGEEIEEGYDEDTAKIRRVRVVERQFRQMKRCHFFVDNMTGDMRQIPAEWNREKRRSVAGQLNLSVIVKMKKAIKWRVIAGRTVLFDDWSPYDDFTVVPYFCYFRRGRPFGLVENLLSPQDTLNKIVSQELHVVNTTANSGWMFESGTLIDIDRDDLEREGAKTGLVIEFARGSTAPAKIQPNQIPTGLDRISTKAAGNIREISGVSDSLLGYDGNEVSGVAIERKQSRGIVQMQVAFDNLNKTREILVKRILKLVQEYYTEERMIRITDATQPENPDQQIMVNQVTPEGMIVHDLTIGEYDVVITSAPARDTYNDSQFAEALSLRNVGVMIPDDTVIEFSSLANRYDIAERVRQQQGTGTPSEEQMQFQQMVQEMEIQSMQLDLMEKEAKASELQTRAMLNQAKAMELGGDGGEMEGEKAGAEQAMRLREIAMEMEQRREELAAEIRMHREKLNTQLEIARMGMAEKREANKMKAMSDQLKNREAMSKAQSSKAKPRAA